MNPALHHVSGTRLHRALRLSRDQNQAHLHRRKLHRTCANTASRHGGVWVPEADQGYFRWCGECTIFKNNSPGWCCLFSPCRVKVSLEFRRRPPLIYMSAVVDQIFICLHTLIFARFIRTVCTRRIRWSCEGLTSIPQQIHWIQLKHLLLRLCTTCCYRI